ncbi:hypothetical protein G6F37_013916 [Rhizopus arrhizus]|nr:hypothetical protein G6F37_013916 [Rhizopus arrhizus]
MMKHLIDLTLEEASRFAIAYDSARQNGLAAPMVQQEYAPNDPMDLSMLVQQLNSMVKSNRSNFYQQERSQTRPRHNIICHWCKKPGHVVAECRTRIREIREFEQNRMRQNKNNGRTQYQRQQYNRTQNNNRVYHADLVNLDPMLIKILYLISLPTPLT